MSALCLLFRLRERWQQHRRQNRYDGNDDQQLDQRECCPGSASVSAWCDHIRALTSRQNLSTFDESSMEIRSMDITFSCDRRRDLR
jgi:hypothetical protein